MDKLKSRKFWMAVLGALMPVVGGYVSQSLSLEQALSASSAVLIAYIVGQAYVDGKEKESGSNLMIPIPKIIETNTVNPDQE
jgi:hypothetical protein